MGNLMTMDEVERCIVCFMQPERSSEILKQVYQRIMRPVMLDGFECFAMKHRKGK